MNSDFKNNRVSDPTKVSEKQIKQIKKYCKDFFDKAVMKHRAYEKKKAQRKTKEEKIENPPSTDTPGKLDGGDGVDVKKEDESDGDGDIKMSDDELDKLDEKGSSPISESVGHMDSSKRKREADENQDKQVDGKSARGDASPTKRLRSSTPPPPPPPPMSPGEDAFSTEDTGGDNTKRKRDDDDEENGYASGERLSSKRQKSQTPPPPPPPPPAVEKPELEARNDTGEHRDYDDGYGYFGTDINNGIKERKPELVDSRDVDNSEQSHTNGITEKTSIPTQNTYSNSNSNANEDENENGE